MNEKKEKEKERFSLSAVQSPLKMHAVNCIVCSLFWRWIWLCVLFALCRSVRCFAETEVHQTEMTSLTTTTTNNNKTTKVNNSNTQTESVVSCVADTLFHELSFLVSVCVVLLLHTQNEWKKEEETSEICLALILCIPITLVFYVYPRLSVSAY